MPASKLKCQYFWRGIRNGNIKINSLFLWKNPHRHTYIHSNSLSFSQIISPLPSPSLKNTQNIFLLSLNRQMLSSFLHLSFFFSHIQSHRSCLPQTQIFFVYPILFYTPQFFLMSTPSLFVTLTQTLWPARFLRYELSVPLFSKLAPSPLSRTCEQ